MMQRPPFALPEDKRRKLHRVIVLEWVTLGFLLSITFVMYLAMGSSQAMKTAWMEDVLSLVPPIAFLIAMRHRHRDPTDRYPYGFRRATLLSFLVASVAVLLLGLYMVYDACTALIHQEHPTIGHFHLWGTTWNIWAGWVMIAALVYSMIPPIVLGRIKIHLSRDLHEKTLYADAAMNKADWMTGGSAIVGIVGIGFGLWWADAAAAIFIAGSVLHDGYTNLKGACAELLDQRPTEVTGEPMNLGPRIVAHVMELPGVQQAAVRLHEEGHVVCGELFIVFEGGSVESERCADIARSVTTLDWRLYDIVVMPMTHLHDRDQE